MGVQYRLVSIPSPSAVFGHLHIEDLNPTLDHGVGILDMFPHLID
jgi:hypothetical protein